MAMFEEMGTVKIGNRGLITMPVEVRKFLKLTPGDKIAFIREDDGYTYVENAANLVLKGSEEAGRSVEEARESKDTEKKRATKTAAAKTAKAAKRPTQSAPAKTGKTVTAAKTAKKPTKRAPAKAGKRKTTAAARG
jgi:AbrB family looped-hinge helix DNA binding protein